MSNTCQKILQDCQERAKVCNSREVNFNREQTDFSMLQNMAKEFNPFYLIWTSIDTFQKKTEEFKNIPLKELNGLDVEEMNDTVKKHLFQSIKILKEMEGFNDLIKTAENFREKSIGKDNLDVPGISCLHSYLGTDCSYRLLQEKQ